MPEQLELKEQKFGKLVVLERAGRKWKCRCDCGKEILVRTGDLRSGNTKSCGCTRKENATPLTDLTGRKIGRLTVIKFDKTVMKTSHPAHYWLCQCECGNTKLVGHHCLMKRKATQSCGCLHKEQLAERSTKPNTAFNRVYSSYTNRCKSYNVPFDLGVEEFYALTQQTCFYCGCKPSRVSHPHTKKSSDFIYNGVDRVDSSKGYTKDNCVPCCTPCNYAKGDRSLDEYKAWLKAAYHHLFTRHALPTPPMP